MAYSPECVEGEFCELRVFRVSGVHRGVSTWHTDVPVPHLDTEGAIAARGGGLHTFLSFAPLKKGVWG